MDPTLTAIIILAILAGVALVVNVALPALRRKGVDVDGIVAQAKQTLQTANNALETLRPFIADKPGVDVFDTIYTAANIGVGNAEQLAHLGKLAPEERKEAAKQYVLDAIKLMGIEKTPDIDRLIDGAIEAGVLELGHEPK